MKVKLPALIIDIIRQIIAIKDIGFATCSNDESVKIWDMSGKLIETLNGHNNYVYTLAQNPNTGELITGSEDNTVKVWRNGAFVDFINHPGTVWTVLANAEGDVITGCEDSKVRCFTRDPAFVAPAAECEEYKKHCTEKSAAKLDVDKLPDSSLTATIKGQKDGQVKVFRTGSNPEAYVWKEAEQKWEKMGDVIMPAPEQKDFHEGDDLFPAGYYDYIFNIDIPGRGEKKLPFNRGSIPLEEAEKFVERENLHKVYVEEISAYIRQQLNSIPTYSVQARPDPEPDFSSAFIQEPEKEQRTEVKHLPMIFYAKYDSVNVDNPQKKILEFNNTLKEDAKYKAFALASFEEISFNGLLNTLKNESNYHLNKIDESKYELLSNKLLKWPMDQIFPVIDVVRMLLMHPSTQAFFGTYDKGAEFLTNVIRCLKPEASDSLLILSLRALCNTFDGPSSSYVIDKVTYLILEQFDFIVEKKNKNILDAASAFLLK
jgi:phospholipase A-2-activating protein